MMNKLFHILREPIKDVLANEVNALQHVNVKPVKKPCTIKCSCKDSCMNPFNSKSNKSNDPIPNQEQMDVDSNSQSDSESSEAE